jgi:hypothetical protein
MYKKESSFSEEKEAKRLHPFAPAGHPARAQRMKFFLLLFCSQKRRPF